MENIGGIFLVFLNVVTPVFILVVIGYFVGPRLKIEARSLSRTAYFVFIPAFVFNIISEAKIDSEVGFTDAQLYSCCPNCGCFAGFFGW